MKTTDYNPHLPETIQKKNEDAAQENRVSAQPMPPRAVLGAGEWLRAVSDFRAPFGFDRLPTVWG